MNSEEFFPIVTSEGVIIGKASRSECHSGTFLLHPVVHLHVFNSQHQLYLQKRVATKDIQPNKWDTSVGGHVDYGELITDALRREVAEELAITDFEPILIDRYTYTSDKEAELINSFYCIYNGAITPNPTEISEGRFWTKEEIEAHLNKDVFTPNFENEWEMIVKRLDWV